MKICPYCDRKNEENEKWCIFCGRPIMDIRGDKKEDKEWRKDIKSA